MIEGVQIQRLEMHCDSRGCFTEVFSDRWNLGLNPRQWSVAHSKAAVLRGMYLHRRHDEFFLLLSGKCSVGLYDLRDDSPTRQQSMLIDLSADHLTYVYFPQGILHGWYFQEFSIHLQAVSEPYSEYHPDDDFGCHWSDPELGITWPQGPKLVSERSAALPPLKVLREREA